MLQESFDDILWMCLNVDLRVLQNSMPECYPEEFVDSLAFVE